jgi:hypothetical protein
MILIKKIILSFTINKNYFLPFLFIQRSYAFFLRSKSRVSGPFNKIIKWLFNVFICIWFLNLFFINFISENILSTCALEKGIRSTILTIIVEFG